MAGTEHLVIINNVAMALKRSLAAAVLNRNLDIAIDLPILSHKHKKASIAQMAYFREEILPPQLGKSKDVRKLKGCLRIRL